MSDPRQDLLHRLEMLGLHAEDVAFDRLQSATVALTCFPMYMVANVHAWTGAEQFRVPLLDLPGTEALREAFVIGEEESRLQADPPHRKVLHSLLSAAKPSDRVIYEYALETLRTFLDQSAPALAEAVRVAVARTVVAVAKASGDGFFGGGTKVSPEERICIERIAEVLGLRDSDDAGAALATLDDEA